MIQKVENKTIERNVTQPVTFTVLGDYSEDTIYFTAKKTSKVSDTTRLIDHLCDTQTYDSETELTTLEFDLVPSETSAIDLRTLYYDVLKENSSTDHEILIKGDLYVTQGYRLDSDEAPAIATPIVSLNANDFDAGVYFKVEDDGSGTNNVFVPKTIAEMKADLGVPKIATFAVAIYWGGVIYTDLTEKTNGTSKTFTLQEITTGEYRLSMESGSFLTGETALSILDTSSLPTGWYVTQTISATTVVWKLFNDSDIQSEFTISEAGKTLRFTIIAVED